MPRKVTPEERFWPKVKVMGPDDCWPWQGATHERGYGRFQMGTRVRQRVVPAHRFAAGALDHPGPVRHTCDNPPCCNPRHLLPGTKKQNMAEMVERGRQAVGSRHGSSKLTESDVLEIRREASAGVSGNDLADRFGVAYRTIRDVLTGKTWQVCEL